MLKKIFQYQLSHLLLALLFLMATAWVITQDTDLLRGGVFEQPTGVWFWLAIATPVLHQVYVAIIWRLELYKQTFTSIWGLKKAFLLYAVGFAVLFVGRLIVIIILAYSNANTLSVEPYLAYILAAVMTPLVLYLFYSVKKYFTVERAFGIDHFDKSYDVPYVKGGIFKYTNNGMYIVGLLILFIPGLLLLSKAALVAGLFNYLYIWVHYFCVEKPDMMEIYGQTPKG